MNMTIIEALQRNHGAEGRRYSDQGIKALTDAVLEAMLSDTTRKTLRVSEVRKIIMVQFRATLRKATFEIIRQHVATHPWFTHDHGDRFTIKRDFEPLTNRLDYSKL